MMIFFPRFHVSRCCVGGTVCMVTGQQKKSRCRVVAKLLKASGKRKNGEPCELHPHCLSKFCDKKGVYGKEKFRCAEQAKLEAFASDSSGAERELATHSLQAIALIAAITAIGHLV